MLRSVKSMVIAPARTGSESKSKIAVIRTAHGNMGKKSIIQQIARIFKTVLIKLIAPRIEETPARCKEKIAKSTAALL